MNYVEDCPVPLLQDSWEFEQLYGYYQRLQPEHVMEIGSFFGGSLYYWLQNENLKTLVSVDMKIPPSDDRYEQMMECRSKWVEWLHGKSFSFFEAEGSSTSLSVIEQVESVYRDGDLDFLYIDGGHEYEVVWADWHNYSPLVRKGGVIALHDVCGLEGVARVWRQIRESGHRCVEISAGKTGWGIGLVFP